MAEWTKQTFKMPKNHGWEAKPGHVIFAADRGAVRFSYPETWNMKFTPHGSIQFRDKPEPDDDALLEVSVMHLNPQVVWADLPLEDFLQKSAPLDGDRALTQVGELKKITRPNLDLVWRQCTFDDAVGHRLAYDHALFAYNNLVMTFISMVFWDDDKNRFAPVWDEVLRTLHVGEPVTLRGPARSERRKQKVRENWSGGFTGPESGTH
jgi:hypothetical protein